MNVLKKLWRAEPIFTGIIGNALFWPTVVGIAAASGHPIAPQTQNLLVSVAGLLTAGAVRQTVTAPDTLDVQLKNIQKVNA